MENITISKHAMHKSLVKVLTWKTKFQTDDEENERPSHFCSTQVFNVQYN